MNIYTRLGSDIYFTDTLQLGVSDYGHYQVTRDGQSAFRDWGITTASLPNGTQGAGYAQALIATLGATPYAWAINSRSLPAGLALSSSGVISGTPTGTGTSSFEVLVTDATSPVSFEAGRFLSLTVNASPLPQNTTPPSIGGTTVQGQVLSASNGSWTNNPTSFTYQWNRCDAGGNNSVAIGGATGSSYAVTSADVGFTIRLAVTATNADGSNTAVSDPTAVIQAEKKRRGQLTSE